MKVATIVPTRYLSYTKDDDFFLCLAHLIGEDKEYTEFFREQAGQGKYVIMDNGAAEGQLLPPHELIRRARLIGAKEIVLPDVLRNTKETLEHTNHMLTVLNLCAVRDEFKLMAVPQGSTIEEWLNCALAILEKRSSIDVLGIPKCLVDIAGSGGRLIALTVLHKRANVQTPIHLLGCWEDPREVNRIARTFKIRSTDSAIAYVYTTNNLVLDPETHARPTAEIDFSRAPNVDGQLLVENIRRWKEYATGVR